MACHLITGFHVLPDRRAFLKACSSEKKKAEVTFQRKVLLSAMAPSHTFAQPPREDHSQSYLHLVPVPGLEWGLCFSELHCIDLGAVLIQ